ncbi:Kinesin light chain [Hondaea fermentalgiana]|uniref:Kinesin light chain n=1 Tax=Hondaea fermentalgiana TaxID=2315210 RepID=A0A2R5G8A6_9STRA|nr:Kinesin light chain [Hondaea fermentalgiana]|eukprot:GBG26775.1 Kinesin light chain [Hondaea fermentalgiana]
MSRVDQDGNGAKERICCSRRLKQLVDLRSISLRVLEASRTSLLCKDVSATNIPDQKIPLLRVDEDGFVYVHFVIEKKVVETNWCNPNGIVQLCSLKGLNINQQVPFFHPNVAHGEGSGGLAVSMNATYINEQPAIFCELMEHFQVWRLPMDPRAIGDARWPVQYLALALECVGWFYGHHGEYDRISRRNKEALHNFGKDLGDHPPKVANTLSIFGALHAQQSRHEEALRYFERALSIGGKAHVVGLLLVPNSLSGSALVHSAQGRYEGASGCFEEALSLFKTVFGNWHSVVASMPSNIEMTFSFQDRNEEALTLYEQALSIH